MFQFPFPFPTPFSNIPIAGRLPPAFLPYCSISFAVCIFFLLTLLFKFLYYASLALAAIFFAWAGILMITQGKIDEARKRLIWGAVGLVVAILSLALVKFISRFLIQPYPTFLPIFSIAYAQELPNPLPYLQCGPLRVPSIFLNLKEKTPENALEICVLYFLSRILSWLYTISLFFSTIMFIYAGILYITKPEESKKTHNIVKYAIIGAIITIGAWSIVRAIEVTLTR
jgi:hypothetical protein